MWYTCTVPCGTPGDDLDGFSTPKNHQFDHSHPSIAPNSQKFDSGVVAVGGTRGTRVQGHVGHLEMVSLDSAHPKTPILTPHTLL